MNDYISLYMNHIREIIDKVENTQKDTIKEVSKLFSKTIMNGNTLYVFGASHAGIIAEELFYRTGGLALINPIFNSSIMLNTRPVTLTSKMERLEGYGTEILRSSNIKVGDTILIHSVSGRNPTAIEMAIEAKKIGANVIALTNIEYSSKVNSRHSCGKNLYELADIVIDNCGDFEDSSMKVEGLEQKVGPTSTVIGALIVNSIVLETVNDLIKNDVEPPVLHSANVDGGDEFNKRIFEKYGNKIHYL
ncbi:SIS domain-containing protein [Oceanotoga teriensis]|uniref:SIS domain-containing protein n=1 Tax=Oceanotoga teriensis TaxID=515440 RepID=UPI002713EE32|nr:SIS domain-containing protein [Oceanotoga teriensis]MDO7976174.1 SIS domain-containing protein [Oceanotoga teriensis]